MFKSKRVRNFVLEQTRETAKGKAGGWSDGDDDDPAVLANADTNVSASSRACGSGHHDDAATGPYPHGRKPPGEKRPEVFGVIA